MKKAPHEKHGLSGTPEYHSWEAMKARCMRKTHPRYAGWGGRGISVCDRWLKFEYFISDMGPCPPGFQIDRINNDGNYEPSNCRWASRSEQVNNRSCNVVIDHDGRSQTLAQWARELGMPYSTLARRVQIKGESPPHAFRAVSC